MISSLLDVKKALESDVGAKQKAFANSKQQLMEVRKKIKKIDTPILVDFREYLTKQKHFFCSIQWW
jgi:cell fate (sporulation/competence/biofilm development) regulator YmcA (YheA/YmcA/DUF963 family)